MQVVHLFLCSTINKLHGCLLNLLLKATSNYQNALQHKLTANVVSSLLWTWVVQAFCARFIIQYHYRSLSKECPWAGRYTSLPNQGVLTLSCVSNLTTKKGALVMFAATQCPRCSQVLMAGKTLNVPWAWCNSIVERVALTVSVYTKQPCSNLRWSITQSFLPQMCITLGGVLLKLHRYMLHYPHKAHSSVDAYSSKCWPYTGNWANSRGWALFWGWAPLLQDYSSFIERLQKSLEPNITQFLTIN